MTWAGRRHLLRRRGAATLAALLLVGVVVAAGLLIAGLQRSTSRGAPHRDQVQGREASSVVVALPPPDLLRPLTPDEAVVENAKRAPVARPDQPAAPFKPKFADDDSRTRALECMTQAIYYEAASEPLEGKEAVAQVVLNRVHHPAYPGSVCGVVYQGSERTTGCQFTFACDGSLRRNPVPYLWTEARKVATRALAGKVFGPVGHATHYHADYVVPYWADSLDKEVQIGRHIFYRLKGGLGAPRSFGKAYGGEEPPALSSTDVQVAAQVIGGATATPDKEELASGLIPQASEGPKPAPILADASHGQLMLDDARPVAGPLASSPPSARDKAPADGGCASAPAVQTKATPLDNRFGRPKPLECR